MSTQNIFRRKNWEPVSYFGHHRYMYKMITDGFLNNKKSDTKIVFFTNEYMFATEGTMEQRGGYLLFLELWIELEILFLTIILCCQNCENGVSPVLFMISVQRLKVALNRSEVNFIQYNYFELNPHCLWRWFWKNRNVDLKNNWNVKLMEITLCHREQLPTKGIFEIKTVYYLF